MKKILTILSLVYFITFTVKVSAETYHLNENYIEYAFATAEDITSQYLLIINGDLFNDLNVQKIEGDDKQMVAGIVAIASFFIRWGASALLWIPIVGWIGGGIVWVLAIFPWHRMFLKAGGQEAKIALLYCITLGWCINAHHVVDGIFLLLDESKSKYINNPKYVMWAN